MQAPRWALAAVSRSVLSWSPPSEGEQWPNCTHPSHAKVPGYLQVTTRMHREGSGLEAEVGGDSQDEGG